MSDSGKASALASAPLGARRESAQPEGAWRDGGLEPALFSVSYAGLWGQDSLDAPAFVRKAADLGYRSVLLMAKRPHLSPLDAGGGLADEIERALDETGLRCLGLACYNDALLPAPAEVPAREMQLLYIDAACSLAARLGGPRPRALGAKAAPASAPAKPPVVRVFTGYSRREIPWRKSWELCVSFLREAGAIARARGVVLAVQNHHDLAVDTAEMERLLDEVDMDSVLAGFDAWSPWLRGEDLRAAARRMASRTVLSIAADYVRRPRWVYEPDLVDYRRELPDAVGAVAMGSGEVGYEAFLAGLAEGGYRGPLVYEMCSPLEGGPSMANLDAKAAAFLAWTRGRERVQP